MFMTPEISDLDYTDLCLSKLCHERSDTNATRACPSASHLSICVRRAEPCCHKRFLTRGQCESLVTNLGLVRKRSVSGFTQDMNSGVLGGTRVRVTRHPDLNPSWDFLVLSTKSGCAVFSDRLIMTRMGLHWRKFKAWCVSYRC